MCKFNVDKQIPINKQHRSGSYEEQPLLFSSVHLILCCTDSPIGKPSVARTNIEKILETGYVHCIGVNRGKDTE